MDDISALSYAELCEKYAAVERENRALRARAEFAESQRDTDEVTALPTRAAFIRLADRLIDSAAPGTYAIACIDIDHFKEINERYGYAEGDRLLRYAADSAKRVPGCALACRAGADSFFVLFSAAAGAETVSEAFDGMMARCGLPFAARYHKGADIIDSADGDAQQCMDNAVTAMKRAKRQHTGEVVMFKRDIHEKTLHELLLIDSAAEAFASKQFVAYYQPQVYIGSGGGGKVFRAEALCRWIRDGEIYAPPSEFIAAFESSGQIVQLDYCMLEQVCSFIRDYIAEYGDDICISVNVSRHTILHPDFMACGQRIIEGCGVPYHCLEVEVTETVAVDEYERLKDVVSRMHSAGIRFSIDDFGALYSSLDILEKLKFDVLKIDRGFFSDTGDVSRRNIVIANIVALAQDLGTEVVAEGIEDYELVSLLRAVGCDYIQGHVFSSAVPAEELFRWIGYEAPESAPESADGDTLRTYNAYYRRNNFNISSKEYDDILRTARIGVWALELDEGKPTRLYASDIMEGLIGVSHGTPPEECYRAFDAGIEDGYRSAVDSYISGIVRSGRGEVHYRWNYPDGRQIVVRCVGVLDRSYDKKGVRMCGYHQDITHGVGEMFAVREAVSSLVRSDRSVGTAKLYNGKTIEDYLFDSLVGQTDAAAALNSVLKALGEHYGADRVIIFEDSEDHSSCSNTYEWCAEGVTSYKNIYSAMSYDAVSGYRLAESSGFDGVFRVASVDDMEPSPFRDMLITRGVNSVLAAGLYGGGELSGYLGLEYGSENPDLEAMPTDTLRSMAKVISAAVLDSRYVAVRRSNMALEKALAGEQRLNFITQAFSKLFYVCYYIDLQSGTYTEIRTAGYLKFDIAPSGSAKYAFDLWVNNILEAEFRSDIRAFVDISTLGERLSGQPYISADYINAEGVWTRGMFFAVDYDSDGSLRHVIFAARTVAEEKEAELASKRAEDELVKANASMREQLDIVGAIAKISYNTYLIDIENDSFRIIKQQPEVDVVVHEGLGLVKMVGILLRTLDEESRRNLEPYISDAEKLRRFTADRDTATLEYRSVMGVWNRAYLVVISRKDNGDADRLLWMMIDIDDEKKREQAARKRLSLAERERDIDRQTGLLNRSAAEQAIRGVLEDPAGGRYALLTIDLDGLKNINDAYGHDHGDSAITAIAESMQSVFGTDDILGRFGGDEFIALVRGLRGVNELELKLRRFLLSVSSHFVGAGDKKQSVTCSVGVVLGTAGSEDFSAAYKCADTALYNAKECGKNTYRFYNDALPRRMGHRE